MKYLRSLYCTHRALLATAQFIGVLSCVCVCVGGGGGGGDLINCDVS